MFPDTSGVTTPLPPIASQPQQDEALDGVVERGTRPTWAGTENASVKSPEPHWDPVIGAATD